MRVWEIREGRDREMDYRMGMRDKSEKMEKAESGCARACDWPHQAGID